MVKGVDVTENLTLFLAPDVLLFFRLMIISHTVDVIDSCWTSVDQK